MGYLAKAAMGAVKRRK